MDRTMGPNFQTGLNNLKRKLEAKGTEFGLGGTRPTGQ